ncbi:hypothetical protein BCR35DRAFT_353864 [Leucosporidium creatinivorum]|uniref:RRM domain-containing protein n=1 Tax=Leucosporidium creatinivorum TaxID=106004 RepID=A0A1Y2ESJ1_9BASI|nr:hypothetical protein BCR35DRAFT_353864 [Leucosporidium creatinivorum]
MAHQIHFKSLNEESLQPYSDQEIATALLVFGQVIEVCRPDRRPSHNYCFVKFDTEEAKINALKTGSVRIGEHLFILSPSFRERAHHGGLVPAFNPTPPMFNPYAAAQPFFTPPQFGGTNFPYAVGESMPGTAERVKRWTSYGEAEQQGGGAAQGGGGESKEPPAMPAAMRARMEEERRNREERRASSSSIPIPLEVTGAGAVAREGGEGGDPARRQQSPLVLSSGESSPRRGFVSPIRVTTTSPTSDSQPPPPPPPADTPDDTPRDPSPHLNGNSAAEDEQMAGTASAIKGGEDVLDRGDALPGDGMEVVEELEEPCVDSAAELKAECSPNPAPSSCATSPKSALPRSFKNSPPNLSSSSSRPRRMATTSEKASSSGPDLTKRTRRCCH